MGYIGKAHQSTSVPARTVSMLTGDGTTTTLTLSQAPMSASNVSVFFDGVAQTPGTDYTLSGSTLTFTSVPPAACVVCAIVGGGENISSPMDGSITTESIVAGAITNAKIASVSASKLTGAAFPALDASNVTFAVQQNLFTKSAADPEETSNVTLGTIWVNTLSGEMFVCIDATTDQNSFMNVGAGTLSIFGNVTPGEPTDNVPDMTESTSMSHTFTGGTDTDGTVTHYHVDQISDANVLSVADAEVAAGSPHVFTATPVSSDTDVTFRVRTKDNNDAYSAGITVTMVVTDHVPTFTQGTLAGFVSGGHNNATGLNINKFSFASEGPSTDWGDLTVPRNATHGSSSGTHGYTGGGYASTANATHTPNRCDTVDKFAFSSSAGATQVGNLAWANFNMAGHEDTIGAAGFFTGGSYSSISGGSSSVSIFKFLHASDGTMINWSSLITANDEHTGTSSSTHGYCAGGNPADNSTYISKFLFASANTNTSVGNLYVNREEMGGSNSATHGYTTGGRNGSNVNTSTIDKYSFSSAGNATMVGDLLFPKYASCGFSGQQYGYDASGQRTTSGATTVIEKYNYNSDSNSTDVGDLTVAMVHIPAGTQN